MIHTKMIIIITNTIIIPVIKYFILKLNLLLFSGGLIFCGILFGWIFCGIVSISSIICWSSSSSLFFSKAGLIFLSKPFSKFLSKLFSKSLICSELISLFLFCSV